MLLSPSSILSGERNAKIVKKKFVLNINHSKLAALLKTEKFKISY